MCPMSKRPARWRTAWCSVSTPVGYCTGISQPPKGTMRPPAWTWTSNRGVRWSGGGGVAPASGAGAGAGAGWRAAPGDSDCTIEQR